MKWKDFYNAAHLIKINLPNRKIQKLMEINLKLLNRKINLNRALLKSFLKVLKKSFMNQWQILSKLIILLAENAHMIKFLMNIINSNKISQKKIVVKKIKV